MQQIIQFRIIDFMKLIFQHTLHGSMNKSFGSCPMSSTDIVDGVSFNRHLLGQVLAAKHIRRMSGDDCPAKFATHISETVTGTGKIIIHKTKIVRKPIGLYNPNPRPVYVQSTKNPRIAA